MHIYHRLIEISIVGYDSYVELSNPNNSTLYVFGKFENQNKTNTISLATLFDFKHNCFLCRSNAINKYTNSLFYYWKAQHDDIIKINSHMIDNLDAMDQYPISVENNPGKQFINIIKSYIDIVGDDMKHPTKDEIKAMKEMENILKSKSLDKLLEDKNKKSISNC